MIYFMQQFKSMIGLKMTWLKTSRFLWGQKLGLGLAEFLGSRPRRGQRRRQRQGCSNLRPQQELTCPFVGGISSHPAAWASSQSIPHTLHRGGQREESASRSHTR